MIDKTPIDITLLQKSHVLQLTYADGQKFTLSCEYLRTHSPSADVRGHGNETPAPVTGKENVNIISIDMVGNYAIKLIFDDGHDTGIYSWDYLYGLAVNQKK